MSLDIIAEASRIEKNIRTSATSTKRRDAVFSGSQQFSALQTDLTAGTSARSTGYKFAGSSAPYALDPYQRPKRNHCASNCGVRREKRISSPNWLAGRWRSLGSTVAW